MGEKDMTEIYQRLGKIEATLARIDERTHSSMEGHADFERRIRSLESWRAWMLGALAVLTPIWSIAILFVSKKLGV